MFIGFFFKKGMIWKDVDIAFITFSYLVMKI